MSLKKRITAGLAATAVLATVAAPAAEAAVAPGANGSPYAGCGSGAVCIYPGTSWNSDPSVSFYSYGSHKIYNQYGVHRVLNNQYGGAKVRLCPQSTGSATCAGGFTLNQFYYSDYDLTPINSVYLSRG